MLGLKENVIIGKLIPAATGLKRYRTIDIGPSDKVQTAAYMRPATEEQLLAALEEIDSDRGDGIGAFGVRSCISPPRMVRNARPERES